jgi:hypothetical protein
MRPWCIPIGIVDNQTGRSYLGGVTRRPVVAVLCEAAGAAPPQLAELEHDVELRVTDEAGLADAVRGAQALFLWDFFSTAVSGVWEQCEALEWIHVAAAGVDTLLFDELRASDVTVTNARGVFDRPIAEYVLGAVLAHAKLLHESHDLQRQRAWRHRGRQARGRWSSAPGASAGRSPGCSGRSAWRSPAPAAAPGPGTPTSARSWPAPSWPGTSATWTTSSTPRR